MNQQTEPIKTADRKTCILQDLQIALWGALAVVLILLAILELIPSGGSGLTMKEAFAVSSSQISAGAGSDYVTELGGVLFNPTDETLEIESLKVTVSSGAGSREIDFGALTIPPRTAWSLSETWQEGRAYERIYAITATLDGTPEPLENSVRAGSFGASLIFVILLIPVAFLLLRAIKVRRYLAEEMRAAGEKEG